MQLPDHVRAGYMLLALLLGMAEVEADLPCLPVLVEVQEECLQQRVSSQLPPTPDLE